MQYDGNILNRLIVVDCDSLLAACPSPSMDANAPMDVDDFAQGVDCLYVCGDHGLVTNSRQEINTYPQPHLDWLTDWRIIPLGRGSSYNVIFESLTHVGNPQGRRLIGVKAFDVNLYCGAPDADPTLTKMVEYGFESQPSPRQPKAEYEVRFSVLDADGVLLGYFHWAFSLHRRK